MPPQVQRMDDDALLLSQILPPLYHNLFQQSTLDMTYSDLKQILFNNAAPTQLTPDEVTSLKQIIMVEFPMFLDSRRCNTPSYWCFSPVADANTFKTVTFNVPK